MRFFIFLGSFNLKNLAFTAIRAPIEVICGCLIGSALGNVFNQNPLFLGALLWLFPSRNLENLHLYRTSLLLSISCASLFGFSLVGLDSMGPITVLVIGFIAAYKWRSANDPKTMPEEATLKIIWDYFAQPLLFSLIGLQLSLAQVWVRSLKIGLQSLA